MYKNPRNVTLAEMMTSGNRLISQARMAAIEKALPFSVYFLAKMARHSIRTRAFHSQMSLVN